MLTPNPKNEITLPELGGLPALPNLPDGGGGVPWIGWYSRKAKRADEVKAALPGIKEGTIYACRDGRYESLEGVPMVLLDAFGYFAEVDGEGAAIRVFGENARGRQEQAQSIMLVLTPSPFAALCSWRGAKCSGLHAHLAALKAIPEEPESKIPRPFRLASIFTASPRTSRAGFVYHLVSASPRPLTVNEAQNIQTFWADPANRESLARVFEAFQGRRDETDKLRPERG